MKAVELCDKVLFQLNDVIIVFYFFLFIGAGTKINPPLTFSKLIRFVILCVNIKIDPAFIVEFFYPF